MANNRDSERYTIHRAPVGGGGFAVDVNLEPLRMVNSAGAGQLDVAEIEVNLARTGTHVENWTSPPYMGDLIEIRDSGDNVVHYGQITAVEPHISPRGETIKLTSRFELFLMGEPVDGIYMYDPASNSFGIVDDDLVFNPVIDGKAQGNRNALHVVGVQALPLFIDPESVRTEASRSYQQDGGAATDPMNAMWSLSDAVYYLCWALNGSQTTLRNPIRAAIDAAIDDDALVLNGVQIPRGLYLGEALDRVLNPAGYHWRIKYNDTTREIEFFQRGNSGTIVQVFHQAYGGTLNTVATNAESIDVKFDAARLVNQVEVRGQYAEYEITAELARAWPESDETLEHGNLVASLPDFELKKDVFRKWVLNEAGDYIGLRPEIDGLFTSSLRADLNAAGLLAQFLPARRRALLPTLTLGSDGTTPIGNIRGVQVEYWNPMYGQSGEEEWLPIPGYGVQLLEHEAGIYLASHELPEEIASPSDYRIRVTACLRGNFRLAHNAVRLATSPQSAVARTVLRLEERFQYRQVTTLSQYYDAVNGGVPTNLSLQANDLPAMTSYANFARDTWDLMDVGGRIVLEGLDHTIYQVGRRVDNVQGREISLESRTSSGAYPQIMAIERNCRSQQMTLHLTRLEGVI